MKRHYYFRLIMGIIFFGCMAFCIAVLNIPSALFFAVMGAVFCSSAHSISQKSKDKEDTGHEQ